MKLLLKLILVALATFSVLVGLRTLGQMIHPGATHYWVGGLSGTVTDPYSSNSMIFWHTISSIPTTNDGVVITNWNDSIGSYHYYTNTGLSSGITAPFYTNSVAGTNPGLCFINGATGYGLQITNAAVPISSTLQSEFVIVGYTIADDRTADNSPTDILDYDHRMQTYLNSPYNTNGQLASILGFTGQSGPIISTNTLPYGFVGHTVVYNVVNSTNNFQIYTNGSLFFTTNWSQLGQESGGVQSIGSDGTVGSSMKYWNGIIFEDILYSNVLTSVQRSSLVTALQSKYPDSLAFFGYN